MDNVWKWSKNSPASPENWSIVAPSYYDAPHIDGENKVSGIVGVNSLKTIEYNGNTIIQCGHYAFKNTFLSMYPSESIALLISADSVALDFKPSNKLLPSLETYEYQDGYISTKRKFIYAPGDFWSASNSVERFKFDISNSNIYSIMTLESPAFNYSNLVLSPITSVTQGATTKNVFVLPEFPAYNISINTLDYILDNIRGLIYSSESTITITYDAVPLFIYIPQHTISLNKLFNTSTTQEQFGVITTERFERF